MDETRAAPTGRATATGGRDQKRRPAGLWQDTAVVWEKRAGVRNDQDASDAWTRPLPAPHLIVNPADDLEFAARVRLAAAGCSRPEQLAARLSREFPSAVVRPRELSGELRAVWYVYRDGHWVPSKRHG